MPQKCLSKQLLLLSSLFILAAYCWWVGWALFAFIIASSTTILVLVILYRVPEFLLAPQAYSRYQAAVRAAQRNDDKQAFHFVQQALAQAPRFGYAYILRGTLHLRDDRAEAAVADFDAAAQYTQRSAHLHLLRTMALARLGKVVEAREAVTNCRTLNKSMRGTAALFAYDYALAQHELLWAYRWQRFWGSVQPVLLNNLGLATMHSGNVAHAKDYLAAALAAPNPYFAQTNLGFLLANAGETDTAITHLDDALRIKPDYHRAWGNRAYAHWLQGDYALALQDINTALAYAPHHLPHLLLLVATYHALGQQGATAAAWHDMNAHKIETLSLAQLQQRYSWHPRFVASLEVIAQDLASAV